MSTEPICYCVTVIPAADNGPLKLEITAVNKPLRGLYVFPVISEALSLALYNNKRLSGSYLTKIMIIIKHTIRYAKEITQS